MKIKALVMAGMMALTAMATTRVAQAQEPLVVNIPFDFVAGNTHLPAGEYAVQVSGPTGSMILISRKDATASVFIGTNAAASIAPQAQSKLIFNRYGDRYYLSQVWQQGYAQTTRRVTIAGGAAKDRKVAVTLKRNRTPAGRQSLFHIHR